MNLCNTGPIFRERQLVQIHDAATMATPSNYGQAFRLWYRTMIGQLMQHSRVVTSISSFSADELVKYFGRPRNGIEVIPGSGEHILRHPADEQVLDRLGLEEGRFVLAVGSRARNKNLRATRAAMALLNDTGLDLVAVGPSNQRVFADTDSDGAPPIFTGYLTDPELRALYQSALCFVFPSLYEGFGLPPLEAMACGCPVIVSDRASLPEVCAGGALYCDPDDPATIAALVRRLLDSETLRNEMIAKGRERTMTFSWASTAAQVASLVARH
jgi:glycosyltransferase involved in cell wall biosynthesis